MPSELPPANDPSAGPSDIDLSGLQPGEASVTFVATTEGVRDALEKITGALPRIDAADDLRMRLELILAEVFNNIVEHAYQDNGEGVVDVGVSWTQDGVWVTSSDQGLQMPGLRLPQGKLPSTDVEMVDLPEGGFGWYLIHNLTHDLTYARVKDKNRLSFGVGWQGDGLF